MLQIVRKKLTPDEISPPNTRYNSDCDCVQSTWDGGATWTNTPGADPRSAPQYQAPGISTSDPACDGAARIAAALKRSIDTTVATSNAVQLASALLDVFLFIVPVIGIIATAIYIAAAALLAIGTAAIESAFTSDVYDQFKCIALCHLDAGGQFTSDEWEAFQTECFDHFGAGTVSDVLQINFDTLGMVGFNNAVSLGTETGDCSACDPCGPWCYLWDFSLSDGGWLVGAQGTWDGTKWVSQNISPATYDILIFHECSGGCGQPMTTITFDAEWFPGTSAESPVIAVFDQGGGYTLMAPVQTMTPGRATYGFDVSAYGSVNSIAANLGSGNDEGGSVALYSVKAEGDATMPVFAGGADCS